ncbi:hypothetical protein FAIPA1_380035 [Frankia sp. AiPs1]
MASPSELGGFDEFREALATWASNSGGVKVEEVETPATKSS